MFKKAVLVGVGLIGGSLGMALCARKIAGEVIGIDISPDNLRKALELKAVHRVAIDYNEVSGADLIILATPVGSLIENLRSMLPYLGDNVIVTDVGSCKVPIVSRAEALLPPGAEFVGGHPMAGSDRHGVTAADRYLFESAYYVLTPTVNTSKTALDKIRRLVKALGAHPVILSPEEHDRIVAAVSHLPHLVACSLMNHLAGIPNSDRTLALGAGGLRDTTRIAAGNPILWRDILLSNKSEILAQLNLFRQEIDRITNYLESGNQEALMHWLERARQTRLRLPSKAKGYLTELYGLNIIVPDQPGSIAKVATLLAEENIIISDLEVLRVREGDAGSIRLAFSSPADRDKAAQILEKHHIPITKE
ncbi:MAG: prephenate dehydrogenase [Peptococcaceae bacterium]|nr:prephenate dehydrogenase [Peptococcaceae bacterium]